MRTFRDRALSTPILVRNRPFSYLPVTPSTGRCEKEQCELKEGDVSHLGDQLLTAIVVLFSMFDVWLGGAPQRPSGKKWRT